MRGGWRLTFFAALTVAILWVMRTPPPPRPLYPVVEAAPVAADLGSAFKDDRCGTLTCQVVWTGPRPAVPPLSMFQAKTRPGGKMQLPNPNAPAIGPDDGLADTVVLLRGVDLTRSRPWDLPPVTVEVNANDMVVHAGNRSGRFGVVRRGETVDLISREPSVHGIRGRGAAFFSQMLFTPDEPVKRRMPDPGIVELSSASWYFWMRGYLIVTDHPYVGVTDEKGAVRFDRLPAGEYELVCWKPNWHIARIDRDPEWIFQTGMVFDPPVEERQPVRISAGQETHCQFRLGAADFPASRVK